MFVAIESTSSTKSIQAEEKLANISEYTKQNEPDTLRYFFSVPREESDVKSIYVIEE